MGIVLKVLFRHIHTLHTLFTVVIKPSDDSREVFCFAAELFYHTNRDVFREREGAGGHVPNRRLSGFFTEKAGFVGTVLSTRNVLWTSNMPEMRWQPGLRPGPHWGSSRRSPRHPSRLRRGTPLFNPHSSRRFWRLDSPAFGAQLRWPPM